MIHTYSHIQSYTSIFNYSFQYKYYKYTYILNIDRKYNSHGTETKNKKNGSKENKNTFKFVCFFRYTIKKIE